MDISQTVELKEESCDIVLNISKTVGSSAINNLPVNSASLLETESNSSALQLGRKISGDIISPTEYDNLVAIKNITKERPAAGHVFQIDEGAIKSLGSIKVSAFLDSNLNSKQSKANIKASNESEAVVKISKPLCADYKSDSETESTDSENNSSTISTNNPTETSSENESDSSDTSQNSGSNKKATELNGKKSKREMTFLDLPPIEDLTISLCEDACVEIGTITNIVDTLVVVESYKGTPALDLDTVLFLKSGKRTLGKVFEILGPITEPIYAVRFNSQEQIKNYDIKKGLKVYFAPKTEHTNFVFMSEVLKNRGSDASWKDNTEAPPEFQDFSDDEEERLHNNKKTGESNGENLVLKEQDRSRKRSFCNTKRSSGVLQASRMRNPGFCQQRRPNCLRNPSSSQFMAPHLFPRINATTFTRARVFPHNFFPCPPHMCHSPRFSGPPIPTFGGYPCVGQNHNFQHTLYQTLQQRPFAFSQTCGSWGTSGFRCSLPPPPPPPPPPLPPSPSEQNTRHP